MAEMGDSKVGPPVRKQKRLPWQPQPESKIDNWVASLFIEKPGAAYELKKGEKLWEYEKRKIAQSKNAASKYPPFCIEPFKDQRYRLYGDEGKGMTPEQRERRARWIKDQQLAPHEPVYVPLPRNLFRRIYAIPGDLVMKGFYKIQGKEVPKPPPLQRRVAGWTLLSYVTIVGLYYCCVHNPATWETFYQGIGVFRSTDVNYEGVSRIKEQQEYFNEGFSKRKALLDLKTSSHR